MKRNTELLEKTMQYIKDNPEHHDQKGWVRVDVCETAACFAGWAAILNGWTVNDVLLCDAPYRDIGVGVLGLDYNESNTLFGALNTRPMLELMVKDLLNGEELQDIDWYRDMVYNNDGQTDQAHIAP